MYTYEYIHTYQQTFRSQFAKLRKKNLTNKHFQKKRKKKLSAEFIHYLEAKFPFFIVENSRNIFHIYSNEIKVFKVKFFIMMQKFNGYALLF